jgi:tetratricopeptide (TPR) repeat protein
MPEERPELIKGMANGSLPPVSLAGAETGRAAADGSARPRLLNATILFVDLMGSVAISNHLTVWEYNSLINDYQDVLREVMIELRDHKPPYPIAEHLLGGDQLAVFFYDPADAATQERADELRLSGDTAAAKALEVQLEKTLQRCLYAALRCAVQIKNAWIGHERNIARVNAQQPVLDVGIGINSGQVVLQRRGDGVDRIEGFAINFAKRVEGYARHGRYCKIMFSKRAYETFRGIIVRQAMLKQRAMFAPYEPQPGMLKGLAPGTRVYELKFFHRLGGLGIPKEQVDLFTQLFKEDPTNLWAYTNLVNYHLFTERNMESALAVAQRALNSNTQNEKIYYDLALVSYELGDYTAAREYCQRCLRLNDEMDVAYDLLADIALKRGEGWEEALQWRTRALTMAPSSAGYIIDVALALAHLGRKEEAAMQYARAVEVFPDLAQTYPEICAEINALLAASPAGPTIALKTA